MEIVVVRILLEQVDNWYQATAMDDVGVLLSKGGASRTEAIKKCKKAVNDHYAPQLVDYPPVEDLR